MPEQPVDEPDLGDVNGDGKVNAVDASQVLAEYALHSTNAPETFDESQKKAADVNGDGKINAFDASMILAYYAYKATNHDTAVPIKEFIAKELN